MNFYDKLERYLRAAFVFTGVPGALVCFVAALVALALGNWSAATSFAIVAYVGTYIVVEA